MEAFIIMPPIIAAFLTLPFMTAWVAKNAGRPYWLWFWLSFILPFISTVILCCLPDVIAKQKEA